MDVETFGKQLIKRISDNTRGGYVLGSNLISAIHLAMIPENVAQEFPRMLYKRSALSGDDETCIVNNDQELTQALEQHWSLTPSPAPLSYPTNMVEVNLARGSDYRRCLLRNPGELKTFKQVTEAREWVEDPQFKLAGRGVPLSDLAQERKEALKRLSQDDSTKSKGPRLKRVPLIQLRYCLSARGFLVPTQKEVIYFQHNWSRNRIFGATRVLPHIWQVVLVYCTKTEAIPWARSS